MIKRALVATVEIKTKQKANMALVILNDWLINPRSLTGFLYLKSEQQGKNLKCQSLNVIPSDQQMNRNVMIVGTQKSPVI